MCARVCVLLYLRPIASRARGGPLFLTSRNRPRGRRGPSRAERGPRYSCMRWGEQSPARKCERERESQRQREIEYDPATLPPFLPSSLPPSHPPLPSSHPPALPCLTFPGLVARGACGISSPRSTSPCFSIRSSVEGSKPNTTRETQRMWVAGPQLGWQATPAREEREVKRDVGVRRESLWCVCVCACVTKKTHC